MAAFRSAASPTAADGRTTFSPPSPLRTTFNTFGALPWELPPQEEDEASGGLAPAPLAEVPLADQLA
jgi:hypothetical protein